LVTKVLNQRQLGNRRLPREVLTLKAGAIFHPDLLSQHDVVVEEPKIRVTLHITTLTNQSFPADCAVVNWLNGKNTQHFHHSILDIYSFNLASLPWRLDLRSHRIPTSPALQVQRN